jgi:hypothetical protein
MGHWNFCIHWFSHQWINNYFACFYTWWKAGFKNNCMKPSFYFSFVWIPMHESSRCSFEHYELMYTRRRWSTLVAHIGSNCLKLSRCWSLVNPFLVCSCNMWMKMQTFLQEFMAPNLIMKLNYHWVLTLVACLLVDYIVWCMHTTHFEWQN